MNPWNVQHVEATGDAQLAVKFADGLTGVVRFADSHFRGVFTALREPSFFKQAFVDHGAVTWPGGQIDLAPDAMYDAIKTNGAWELR
jgi:hypothetical protein